MIVDNFAKAQNLYYSYIPDGFVESTLSTQQGLLPVGTSCLRDAGENYIDVGKVVGEDTYALRPVSWRLIGRFHGLVRDLHLLTHPFVRWYRVYSLLLDCVIERMCTVSVDHKPKKKCCSDKNSFLLKSKTPLTPWHHC